jgi:hypothetical protein
LHNFKTEAVVLLDERKPLGTDARLESDLLEREFEKGVLIEQEPDVRRDRHESFFGGLLGMDEHVETEEIE